MLDQCERRTRMMQNNEMLSTMKHIKSTNQSLPEQVAAQINQLIIDQNISPEQKLDRKSVV